MTNFDPEIRNNELISDTEAAEISKQLSASLVENTFSPPSQRVTTDGREMDAAASMTYLRNTYSHLYESQFGKLVEILSDGGEKNLKFKQKHRINLRNDEKVNMDGEEEDENHSANSLPSENLRENNDEVSGITKDIASMKFEEVTDKLKPIITFTPSYSADKGQECRVSPFSDPPSSGASSPLLEVPVRDFGNLVEEMMRPPINNN